MIMESHLSKYQLNMFRVKFEIESLNSNTSISIANSMKLAAYLRLNRVGDYDEEDTLTQ